MLARSTVQLLIDVRKALRGSDVKARATALEAVEEALLADSDAKARLGDRVSLRAGTPRAGGGGRKPSAVFTIAVEPGYHVTATGGAAAHAALEAALKELGAPRKLPTQNSLQVSLSRGGHWHCLVETDNGTVSVTVTKQAKSS